MAEQSREQAKLRPCIVLLGPPGSGKGTQAELLEERLGIPAISTGDMLRAAVAEGSELGRRVEGVMEAGELVDDEMMAQAVAERLRKPDTGHGFLLDGYPRTLGQARDLEAILGEVSARVVTAVAIEAPEAVLVERMAGRGRSDDEAEVIQQRIRVYREKTEPLMGYYKRLGLLERVDGDQPIDAVQVEILQALSAAGVVPPSEGRIREQPGRV